MTQTDMTGSVSPLECHAEPVSLPVEMPVPAQMEDAVDEKQEIDPASTQVSVKSETPDISIPIYVKGWRFRLLLLGSALRNCPSAVIDD